MTSEHDTTACNGADPTADGTRQAGGRRPPSYTTRMGYHVAYLRLRWRWETGRDRTRSDRHDRLSFAHWFEETEAGMAKRYDYVAFAHWLVARKASVAAGSWRRMRAAALAGLDFEGAASARAAEALLRAETATSGAKPSTGPERRRRAGDGDLARMLRALAKRAGRGSEIARVAALWLRAGRAAGLRPGAWRGACLLPADAYGGPYLRLAGSAGEADGGPEARHRLLDLAGLAPDDRGAAEGLVVALDAAGATGFDRLRRRCTELLSRVNAQLWPNPRRSLTLDFCRRGGPARPHAAADRGKPPRSVASGPRTPAYAGGVPGGTGRVTRAVRRARR